jgi:hypothetical protein
VTPFDLLFLFLFLTAVVSLLVAAVQALRGRGARALTIVRRVGIVAAAYFCVLLVVSAVAPARVLAVGDDHCSDDWCIGVSGARRAATTAGTDYDVDFRLRSRARRVNQREHFVAVYLRGRDGRRYDPVPDARAVPFDTLLHPGETVAAPRRFHVPAGAVVEGAVISRTGGAGWFPRCCIIADEGSLLHRPTIVRLD